MIHRPFWGLLGCKSVFCMSFAFKREWGNPTPSANNHKRFLRVKYYETFSLFSFLLLCLSREFFWAICIWCGKLDQIILFANCNVEPRLQGGRSLQNRLRCIWHANRWLARWKPSTVSRNIQWYSFRQSQLRRSHLWNSPLVGKQVMIWKTLSGHEVAWADVPMDNKSLSQKKNILRVCCRNCCDIFAFQDVRSVEQQYNSEQTCVHVAIFRKLKSWKNSSTRVWRH